MHEVGDRVYLASGMVKVPETNELIVEGETGICIGFQGLTHGVVDFGTDEGGESRVVVVPLGQLKGYKREYRAGWPR